MNGFLPAALCCIALEIGFVPWFLKAEYPRRTYRSLALKMICSALFCLTGVFSVCSGGVSPYAGLVLGALFCSALGDFLLHYEDIVEKDRFFLYGMIAFAVAHLLYLTGYCLVLARGFPDAPVIHWLSPVLLVLLLGAAELGSRIMKLQMGRLHLPVGFYTAILTFTVIQACYLAIVQSRAGGDAAAAAVLAAGALLFAVSDATIGVLHFGRKKPRWLRAVNIVTYYAAQCLLALTVLFCSA